ncbi:hypothetical protein JQ604_32300 [Bradyrhizobium jicamae]|uniref:M12 family metallopeptidase n=1 Tax=Bradyrhizobium jicamae TaxID=280332 RepID=UPI001BA661AC|nr:M12 family metallopeptidase [Bradyrhizobium jicamae]MBR0756887.1 hypothetical protein [Bradyrhizobium jicamae]
MRARALRLVAIFSSLLFTLPARSGEIPPSDRDPLEGIPPQYLARVGNDIHFGDMIFKARQPGDTTLGAVGGALWPNGILVYAFDAALTDPTKRSAFVSACNAWTVNTPIICRLRSNEVDYVLVREHMGDGCFPPSTTVSVSCSYIGMVGKAQNLSVHVNHWGVPYVLIHEIGHALGLIHEHQRSNRGGYVEINFGNVIAGAEPNFVTMAYTSASDYDYDSIMHYGNCLFSNFPCDETTFGTQTIWPVGCQRDKVGGASISALDQSTMRNAYVPIVMALFASERSSKCGLQEYSQQQTHALCGENCTHASAMVWIRETVSYDSECGVPFPAGKGPAMCAARRQEHIRHWFDVDHLSCGFPPRDKNEIWARCGCSRQTLNLTCNNMGSAPSEDGIEKLSHSKASREWSFGRNIRRLRDLMEASKIDAEAIAHATRLAIANYRMPGFPWRFGNMQFWAERHINKERRRNPTYLLSVTDVEFFATKAGLATTRIQ